jgi:hypothetical protein
MWHPIYCRENGKRLRFLSRLRVDASFDAAGLKKTRARENRTESMDPVLRRAHPRVTETPPNRALPLQSPVRTSSRSLPRARLNRAGAHQKLEALPLRLVRLSLL